MNPTIDPNEKIEIVPETVASTDQPFGYETDRAPSDDLPEPLTPAPEPLGLALLSAAAALGLPIVAAILWASVRVNVHTAEAASDMTQYTISSIVLFLVLIFVVPVTTIFSLITAYLAFRRSQKIGRWVAAGSVAITLVGVVLLVLFISALQTAADVA